MSKFQNKFRNETFRAQWWDYSRNGAYFITICTQHKECYFGEIKSGKIKLTEMGQIAQSEWTKTIEIRCDMNIKMGEFVVMPNHVHGIIIIENDYMDTHVGTPCMASLQMIPQQPIISDPNPKMWHPSSGGINRQ